MGIDNFSKTIPIPIAYPWESYPWVTRGTHTHLPALVQLPEQSLINPII